MRFNAALAPALCASALLAGTAFAQEEAETSTSVVSKEFGAESDEEAPKKVEAASFEAGFAEEEAPSSGGEQNEATDFLSKLNLKVIVGKFGFFLF